MAERENTPRRSFTQSLGEATALPARPMNSHFPGGSGQQGLFYENRQVALGVTPHGKDATPNTRATRLGPTAFVVHGDAHTIDAKTAQDAGEKVVRVKGEIREANIEGPIHLIVDLVHGEVVAKDGGRVTQVNKRIG